MRYEQAIADGGGTMRFVPVGELAGQVGDWEVENAANNKQALLAGEVTTSVALPDAPPTQGEVVWAGGERLSLPVFGAPEGLKRLSSTGSPAEYVGCRPLDVTGAELVTTRIRTTRGTRPCRRGGTPSRVPRFW